MKSGLGAVITAVAGIVYMIWVNIYHSESLADKLVNAVSKPGAEEGFMTTFQQYQMVGVVLAIIAIYSGVKSMKNGGRLGGLGLILGIVLMILIFTPFGQHLAESAN